MELNMNTSNQLTSEQQSVESHVREWINHIKEKVKLDKDQHRPVIMMSREFGAHGASMGRLVAEQLGFTFWDQKMLHIITSKNSIHDLLFSSLGEEGQRIIEDRLERIQLEVGKADRDYLYKMVRIIKSIEYRGNSLIVGRGGHFVVDDDKILRVRVFSPEEQRVKDYAESRGVSIKQASSEVQRVETQRREFIRKYYHKELSALLYYDLLINAEAYTLSAGADIILAAYKAKFGSEAYRRLKDVA